MVKQTNELTHKSAGVLTKNTAAHRKHTNVTAFSHKNTDNLQIKRSPFMRLVSWLISLSYSDGERQNSSSGRELDRHWRTLFMKHCTSDVTNASHHMHTELVFSTSSPCWWLVFCVGKQMNTWHFCDVFSTSWLSIHKYFYNNGFSSYRPISFTSRIKDKKRKEIHPFAMPISSSQLVEM